MEEKLLHLLKAAQQAKESKNYDQAINLYEEAIRLPIQNDDKAMLFEFIGQCYDRQEREHLAFENFGKAFEADPEYENGWYLFYRYAELAYRFRQFNVSIEYLEKIVGQIPPDSENYIQYTRRLLGLNYLQKKEHEKATLEFKKALKRSTNSKWKSHIYDGLAYSYFGLDKIGEAIKFGLKALNEEFDEIVEERMFYLLAFCYGMWGIHQNSKKEQYYTELLKKKYPNSAYLRELQLS
jgi:tetratricopeptide (TPR) repeat protein